MTKPFLLPPSQWWAWCKRNKTLLLACLLTGGEGLASVGMPLPLMDFIPQELRGIAIATLGGLALWFRIRAGQEKARG